VNEQAQLVGVLTRRDIRERIEREGNSVLQRALGELVRGETIETYPDQPLRVVVYRMAETGFTRLPVLDGQHSRKLVGMISLHDLLRARTRSLEEERHRERVLRIRLPFAARGPAAVDRST